MKSAMPFHGVAAVPLRRSCRELFRRFPFESAMEWRRGILDLWRNATHREERYGAIELLKVAAYRRRFLDPDLVPLLEEMIRDGAWWDYVDAIATGPLGELLERNPREVRKVLLAWSKGSDLWLRRAAILAQLHFGDRTDRAFLEKLMEPSLGSREFFLAKAIGWALRQFARSDPAWVLGYVERNRRRLAPLSVREATKHL
jgi:3-methyladenine DNA glycosylase AlkD